MFVRDKTKTKNRQKPPVTYQVYERVILREFCVGSIKFGFQFTFIITGITETRQKSRRTWPYPNTSDSLIDVTPFLWDVGCQPLDQETHRVHVKTTKRSSTGNRLSSHPCHISSVSTTTVEKTQISKDTFLKSCITTQGSKQRDQRFLAGDPNKC